MATRRPRPAGFSIVEVVCLLLIAGVSLALLVPGMAVSREFARRNVCSRNLRRLDLAALERLPQPKRGNVSNYSSWPNALRPSLEALLGIPSRPQGAELMTSPRPVYLTCPSHMYVDTLTFEYTHLGETYPIEVSQYVLVTRDPSQGGAATNREKPSSPAWYFQDRTLQPPAEEISAWYVGTQIRDEVARQRARDRTGPHFNGTFVRTDGEGGTRFVPSNDR